MAVTSAPPKRTENKVSEDKIKEIINKGGKPTFVTEPNDVVKGITIKLLGSELDKIKELRSKRPSRGKKLGISLHDWIIEAVQEKLNREMV